MALSWRGPAQGPGALDAGAAKLKKLEAELQRLQNDLDQAKERAEQMRKNLVHLFVS